MKYETQKWRCPFRGRHGPFALQIVFGTFCRHRLRHAGLPVRGHTRSIMRMSHTNLLLVWLLIGFFGCAALLPEEAETEIGAGAAALIGYQFEIHGGRHYLEQPVYVKVLLTISFLMFLFNALP